MTLTRLFNILLLGLFLAGGIYAQDEPEPEKPDRRVSIVPVGVQRYSPNGWGAIAVVAANDTEEDVEERVSLFLNDDSSLQYSRRFWIPSRSRRLTWIAVRLPEDVSPEATAVDVSMIRLVEKDDGGEGFAENDLGMPVSKRSVLITTGEVNTGVSFDKDTIATYGTPFEVSTNVIDTVYAGREPNVEKVLDLAVVDLNASFLPPTHLALDQLDQLVIGGDNLLTDTVGMDLVRQWIRDGGRAWIQLDLTSAEFVNRLLGDDALFEEVDRVELNDFEFVRADLDLKTNAEPWSAEVPVEFVRVFADVDEVAYRIDGWPAAFWLPYGEGEILFTALGARGWRTPTANTVAYDTLASRFFESRNRPADFDAPMIRVVDEQIGYRIPERSLAAGVLGLNALIVFGTGLYWARQRRLERLAILIPATAILSSGILVAVGNRQTSAVPSTVATGQLVRVMDATGELDISSVQAVYSQTGDGLGLISNLGTHSFPLQSDNTVGTRRIEWDDTGASRWGGTNQPPGVVRHVRSRSNVFVDQPILAVGTFDQQGFVGRIEGLDGKRCEDGVIFGAPAPPTSARIESENVEGASFRANATDRLPKNQYYSDSLISDQQQSRQRYLRELLATPDEQPFGQQLSMLVWSDPIHVGNQYDERFTQIGSSLIQMPIRIIPPKPGSDFIIPTSFIRTDAVDISGAFSTVFNVRTGEWLPELTKPTEAVLIYRFPRELGNMTLRRVDLDAQVSAPGRNLRVKSFQDGNWKTVVERRSPIGRYQWTIEDADALRLEPDGSLRLVVQITESENVESMRADQLDARAIAGDSTTWKIDFLHLTATGAIENEPETNSQQGE
ncbi:MAG: hypothetical protein AAFU85_07265 [Planctomycetota bacterium]